MPWDVPLTSYAYDAAGNRIQVTDPLNNTTVYGYDSLNRQVSIKDALGNVSTTAYDAAGHVLKRTDASGNATQYFYDAIGRQTSILDAAGGRVSFQYDGAGNRVQITDARGKATQFTYDGMNRLLNTTDPLGNVTKNQYDAVGNLTQVTDGNGNTKSYQYDGNRRQTKVAYSTGGAIQFTYDANGNRTQMVDLVGTSAYTYDDLNRLQSYRNPTQASLAFSYDAASNRTAIQYPGNKTAQYTYDAVGRIASVSDWNGFTANYTYDDAGRLLGVGYSNGLTSQYTYDADGQNTRTQHNNGGNILYSEATTWSANGNPTSSDISGINPPGLQPENTTYSYNDEGELVGMSFGTMVSDKNGNLTIQSIQGEVTTFAYDLNNRVTNIWSPSIGANIRYLGDGKIAELDALGSSHQYLIDPTAPGNRILAELDSAGGLQVAYVYGPRGMFSQISGGQTYTYFHNPQGSTVALADGTGAIRNSYRYDPFGHKLSMSSEQIANTFVFLGRFSVPSVGQYSVTTHRIYDSLKGRFSGLDPLRFQLGSSVPGWNLYSYANQSPVRLVDPSGLIAQTALSLLSSIGGVAESALPSLQVGTKVVALPDGSFAFESITAEDTWLNGFGTTLSGATAIVGYLQDTVSNFTDSSLTYQQS